MNYWLPCGFYITVVILYMVKCSGVSRERFKKRANEYLTCPTSSRMYSYIAESSRECAIMCSKETDCRTVNYKRSSSTCELLAVSPSQFGVTSSSNTEWTVYYKEGGCDGVIYGKHCYLHNSEWKTWEEARQNCLALNANLVYIEDAAENTFVTDLAKSYSSPTFWIGLNDLETENFWKWSIGTNSTYLNFANGEPSNGGGNEHCVGGLWNSNGQWNDHPCSEGRHSICKLTI